MKLDIYVYIINEIGQMNLLIYWCPTVYLWNNIRSPFIENKQHEMRGGGFNDKLYSKKKKPYKSSYLKKKPEFYF